MKHLGDICNLKGESVPIVDIVVGGSPCQDLSVAGNRAGLNGERSGLFMEQIRLIKEMRQQDEQRNGSDGTNDTRRYTRPRFMVWENVPGAFSSNGGEDFRIVLEETARVVDSNAVIPRPADGWTLSGCILADRWSIAWRVHDAQFWGVPQRRRRISLVADFGGQSAASLLFERKSLPGDFETSGEKRERDARKADKGPQTTSEKCYAIQGGGLTSQTIHGSGISENISFSLNTIDNHAVAYRKKAHPTDISKAQNWEETQINDTLNIFDNTELRTPTLILEHNAQAGRIKISDKDICQTLSHKMGTGGNNTPMILKEDDETILRRLTPLECERLQGFPDGWTDIGTWTDSKGKKHTSADSLRYKALGNSIALPFWQWLADRMIEELKAAGTEQPTMASLFDGIGGFPLVFSRCGCVPVWASEIEEFPIAVTKLRFPDGEKEKTIGGQNNAAD